MVKKILVALGLLVAVLLVVAAFQPDDFRLSRSTLINATPAEVFPHANDFHLWQEWSPWAKLDPSAKATFEGPSAGVGAIFGWAGNSKVGEGKMTIIKSQSPELIHIQLDFVKPMPGTNLTEFTFAPEGQGTRVTWTMSGKANYIQKLMCLIMNMDKMVGPEFEKGLAQMKTIVESAKK